METVVDVSVKVGEETMEFKQLPAALSIANFGSSGVVVSESREAMNRGWSDAKNEQASAREHPLSWKRYSLLWWHAKGVKPATR